VCGEAFRTECKYPRNLEIDCFILLSP